MTLRSRKTRWWYFVVPVTLLAVAAGVYYFTFGKVKPPQYMTAPVARADVETTVLATGKIEAKNLVSVGAQVSGQINALKVALGDEVTAGQLVAEIDSLPQQNTLRNKTAALATVRAQKQAKEANLHQAELTFKRQEQMLQGEAGSLADYETADTQTKVLRAEIAALDAQIEQAKIAVDTAQLDLNYTRITSPIDGTVVAIVTKEGQTVNANQSAPTIIKVARLDMVTIKVEISEADVVRVAPGQAVYFTILGEPDNRYNTTLLAIEPAPESIAAESSSASATSASSSASKAIYYIGLLDVPNSDGKLRIDMTAQVNIVLDAAKNVLTIPSAALGDRSKDGRYTVRVEKDLKTLEKRRVRIGLNNNVLAVMLEGLEEGERVVIGDKPADSTTPRMRNMGPMAMPRIR
ncbi:MAG: efflux RND transporter periplasmic adaptor subunit [Proteobacteria bacterium]|nr:efflux RND transporter periplasmic adaptor subunit [Pseudomonadota bacterium]